MVHCGIFAWCIAGFVRWAYCIHKNNAKNVFKQDIICQFWKIMRFRSDNNKTNLWCTYFHKFLTVWTDELFLLMNANFFHCQRLKITLPGVRVQRRWQQDCKPFNSIEGDKIFSLNERGMSYENFTNNQMLWPTFSQTNARGTIWQKLCQNASNFCWCPY